jgi:hypothetical protein
LDGYKPTHTPENEKDLTSKQIYAVSQSALTELLQNENRNHVKEAERVRLRFEDEPSTSNARFRLESFPDFKPTIKVQISKLDSESETDTSNVSLLSSSSVSVSNPVENMEKYITKKKEADTKLTTDINPDIDID